MRFLNWVMRHLKGPWAGRVVIVIALALALPSIFSPFFIDEHVQAIKWKASQGQKGQPASGSILNDYFVFSDRKLNRQEMEQGLGAWWTAPDFQVAFWRPFSAASHVMDHILWPGNAVLMHLHTLLWFLALLIALNALYRRFLSPTVASLALVLYAWDDARGMLFSWIANRHALIAGFFGICVLIAYDKWRRDGWRPGAWLGPVLFALGLLAGEMGLATTAFLFGYAFCLDKGVLVRRMARLLPYLLVVVVWQVIYSVAGYGVEASGSYLNPLHEPLSFVAKLFERAPILAFAQLTPFAGDFWGMYPPAVKIAVFVLALAMLVIVTRIAWPRLAADPRFRFWLIGAGLSLTLICATGPQDRNLVFVGFGAAPALALVFASLVDNPPVKRWPRFVVGALAVFNLALAPLLLPAKSLTILGLQGMLMPVDKSIPRDPAVVHKTLVVAWIAFEPSVYFSWVLRDDEGIPRPGKTRILATSFGDVSITRLDEVTLRLRPSDGFFASEVSKVFRSSSRPFHVGEVVKLSNMTATVTEITDDGRPQTVEFRFTSPLESPEWLWMRGAGHGLIGWTPPKVGETVRLPSS
jgi:hypothetical protein